MSRSRTAPISANRAKSGWAGRSRRWFEDRGARLPAFRDSLAPLRRTLERQKFLAGDAPAYADYIVFGAFQWARAISDFELLAGDDPVAAWRGRLLDAFGGLARKTPAYGG